MSYQLDLNFGGYDQPNHAGVFTNCEVISMPSAKRSIRAEIRVAFTAAGFCWGSSAFMEMQGHASMPNVCDIPAGRVVSSKAEAIAKACDDIQRHVGKLETKGAKAIMAWARQLRGTP